ncbi:MAG: hypothetical protein PHQ27_06155 [Victivallales bacterium]|nr:hypothetical protein [Victivallales bacterium]
MSRHSRPRRRRHCFTLLEMVMALVILMVMMSTIGMTLLALQRGWHKITLAGNAVRQLQVIDRVVDIAFRNAVPFHWNNAERQEIMVFAGESDTLLLTYLHRIDRAEDGGIRFLRLLCRDHCLTAEYRRAPLLPEPAAAPNSEVEILSEHVDHIFFRYADITDGDLVWYDRWDNDSRRNLPLAIQMTVVWQDGRREIWLRRTAGSGQFQSLGQRLPPLPQ